MGSQGLFRLYLALAVAGAVLPYWLFVPWLAEHGFAPGLFVAQLFATAPASVFASDALFSAVVFVLFSLVEGKRLAMPHRWLPPLVVVTIGLCCAMPLFLALRERALATA